MAQMTTRLAPDRSIRVSWKALDASAANKAYKAMFEMLCGATMESRRPAGFRVRCHMWQLGPNWGFDLWTEPYPDPVKWTPDASGGLANGEG